MTTLCTITSRSFHTGTALLINSLVKAGFRGRIVVGYMDGLPVWSETVRTTLARFEITLEFLKISATRLAFYQKVDILKHCIDVYQPNRLFFFDSDIVVKTNWDFFETWAGLGIALCSDVHFLNMPDNHPMRHYWRKLLVSQGYPVLPRTGYANGGFIGLNPDCFGIVDIWHKLIAVKSAERGEGNINFVREHGFRTIDQDLLNAALMATDLPVSLAGLEGMGFASGSGYMLHAIGPRKPWQRGFLRDLIYKGRALPLSTRMFWSHAIGPIEVFSPIERKMAQLEMNVTAALSRLIAR